MRLLIRLITSLAVFVIIPALILPCASCSPTVKSAFKIGVLMPLSGPDAMESEKVLDWAAQNLNASGGIDGRQVELIYRDTYQQDILTLAWQFLNDPEINIVIGPQRSDDVFLLAPLFIQKHKLLISPTATSADITRAFSKKGYFWRTVQSDVAQLRCILDELHSRQVKRVSLIYVNTSYGQTFYQWTGFFAEELGMDVVRMAPYKGLSDLEQVIDEVLAGQPEYIIAVAYAAETVRIKQIVDSKNTPVRLFFTDAAETPYVITELGENARGLELMTPAADPNSGFESEFNKHFGYLPFDFSAAHYDAFLLAAGVLARQHSLESWWPFHRTESLAESFIHATSEGGPKVRWDQIGSYIKMVIAHEAPDVDGAGGHLVFDKENGVDPVQSFYSLNKVESRNGVFDFWTTRRFSSDESADIGLLEEQSSAVFTRASTPATVPSEAAFLFKPSEPRENLRAVIICTSSTWDNYRHQSDALAIYDLLKKNGLSDKNIIFLSEDDIPWVKENPLKGDVHHVVGGPNLRKAAEIDYTNKSVNLETLRNVLTGIPTPETPAVLESDRNSNVFIYMVDHGAPGLMPFVHGEPLTSSKLAAIVDEMNAKNKYRQMLIMVEACFGGSIGSQINTPGVLYLTGASKMEASFGATYDSKIKQWLADDFTAKAISNLKEADITILNMYIKLYKEVNGSHVTIGNHQNFGDLSVPISDFIRP
ncbi:hypothetical protein FJZ31_43235 [Candidatus Poribacteria bacterium]|nr:hypothetical protein [Candidatus Poribacteria bacterium]